MSLPNGEPSSKTVGLIEDAFYEGTEFTPEQIKGAVINVIKNADPALLPSIALTEQLAAETGMDLIGERQRRFRSVMADLDHPFAMLG